MADFDGDGLLDLIELENTNGRPVFEWQMHVWKGRGDGRFGLASAASPDPCGQDAGGDLTLTVVVPEAFGSAIGNKTVAMYDLNGNSLADLVAAGENGIVLLSQFLAPDGGRFFSSRTRCPSRDALTFMHARDAARDLPRPARKI